MREHSVYIVDCPRCLTIIESPTAEFRCPKCSMQIEIRGWGVGKRV